VAVATPVIWTYPGLVKLKRCVPPAALPAPASRFTATSPVPDVAGPDVAGPDVAGPDVAGAAITATAPPAPPAHPGDGQARVADVTATDRTGETAGPAESVTECLTPLSP
jgi:hypothetical protein